MTDLALRHDTKEPRLSGAAFDARLFVAHTFFGLHECARQLIEIGTISHSPTPRGFPIVPDPLIRVQIRRIARQISPFVPNPPPEPLRVFSVDDCTAGALQASRSVPNPAAVLHTLYQEQERRKRVLGWRRTHKDPFAGEWDQIMGLSDCQSRTEQRRHLPRAAAPLRWTLSALANPYLTTRHAENTGLPLGNVGGVMARGSDLWPITSANLRGSEAHQAFLTAS